MHDTLKMVRTGLKHCCEMQNCFGCPYIDSLHGAECMDLLNADALKLIEALYSDVSAVRACTTCAYYEGGLCDMDGDGKAFERWRNCMGSMKINWKWRGENGGE